MNYRHAFHAGNFADLLKHAIVLDVLGRMTASPRPLSVIDTHAGAGAYDLTGPLARKTGEAEGGIGRLMADPGAPGVFAGLKAAVARLNPGRAGQGGTVRRYPGSPLLIAEALRPGDRYLGCELRPDDAAALRDNLRGRPGAAARAADGWAAAPAETLAAARSGRQVLVLIDPPFERGDDYPALASATAAVLSADPAAVLAIWAPIKDLTTFDGLVGAVEDAVAEASANAAVLVSEARLRPLRDPMRMNGSALLVVNPPAGAVAAAAAAADWIAARCGEAGARAETRLI